MAVENPEAKEFGEHQLVDVPSHPLWNLSIAIPMQDASEKRYAPKRYLNPGCFEDLFSMHQASQGDSAVSKSTLNACWNQRWKRFLDFRNIGQGKRCRKCAKLDEERLQAVTADEKHQLAMAKQAHIEEVKADRQVSTRGTHIAERDAANPTSDGYNQVLKVTIDGMDQAKFKCPRNLANSAEFSSSWRPQLHVVGCIIPGHFESYYIMGSDLAKDANMNCTIISRALDLEKLGDAAMPRTLVVSADNTTRESKNQYFATYLSMLVSSGRFESVELQFMQVGHTRNEQDHWFSTLATVLSRAPVLECPEEFCSWIKEHVTPLKGHVLHVEVLEVTYDFQKWFIPLGVQMVGLAATHLELDTNHVWRFCQRSLVHRLAEADIECHHSESGDMPQSDSDAILF